MQHIHIRMPYCKEKHLDFLQAVCNNIRCNSHPNIFERMNKIVDKWTKDVKRNEENVMGQ